MLETPTICHQRHSTDLLQAIKRDVQQFVDQRSLDEYFPNSYTVITLSLAAWGLAQLFVPWELLDLLVSQPAPRHESVRGLPGFLPASL